MTKKKKNKKGKSPLVKGAIAFGIIVVLTLVIYKGIDLYNKSYEPNVRIADAEEVSLKIPTGSDFNDVYRLLTEKEILIDTADFSWMAEKMDYTISIQPGHYVIKDEMTNRDLIRMLRSGDQTPVKVMFHNIKTLESLSGTIAEQIEADSVEILHVIKDDEKIGKYDFTNETIYAMFIPNTYELYWNTNADEFLDRMHTEYDRFWTESRTKKLEALDMEKLEVSTLASIVDEETYINEEMPTIAGVFLNRLDKGIRLQADPTVKFAVGNVGMRRVLKKHLEIDSPYNTYRNAGLPPGPISVPSIAAIDAVLEAEDHDYIYFAAKPDFSGFHNFAKTLDQHLRYAREYQRALNRQRIYR